MRTLTAVMLSFLAVGSVMGQPSRGRTEVSISASLQSIGSTSSDKTSTNFIIAPRVGFFVFEGLELEPEAVLVKPEAVDATYMLNGNVSYNFETGGRTMPFVLAGYGIANSVPVLGFPLVRYDFTIGVLNLGGGVKGFVADNVAIRIEYRYQKFTGEKTEERPGTFFPVRVTTKVDNYLHTFQFGLSVFF